MGDIIFDASGFVKGLQYMGFGLLGTFLIIGIIIGVTMGFNYASNKIAERIAAKENESEKTE